MNALIKAIRAYPRGPASLLHTSFKSILSDETNHTQLQKDLRRILPSIFINTDGPYTRTIIASEDNAELAVLAWHAGATSGWHTHPGRYGSFCVVSGELIELVRSPEGGMIRLKHAAHNKIPSAVTNISDTIGSHTMLNATCRPAYSLHLYTSD